MTKLFGGKPKVKIPDPPKPVPMADEDAINKAKRRAVARTRQSGGRESTILGEVGGAEKLGG